VKRLRKGKYKMFDRFEEVKCQLKEYLFRLTHHGYLLLIGLITDGTPVGGNYVFL
jgi:hypothetical protein